MDPPTCLPSPPLPAASWYAGSKSRNRTETGSSWATRSVRSLAASPSQSGGVTVLPPPPSERLDQVVYKEKDSDSAVHFWTVEGNATHSVQLTGLGKYVLYEIQVLAFTRMGDGRPSSPAILERTLDDVPGPPVGILFPEVRTTSVRLIWQSPSEPNGIILGESAALERLFLVATSARQLSNLNKQDYGFNHFGILITVFSFI